VNDPPALSGIGGSVGYVNGAKSIALAAFAKVSDLDSSDFNAGQLTVKVTSGDDASNRLLIGGAFAISGSNLVRNGVVIGSVDGNGQGTNDLQFTFNDQASASIVQELIRTIRFRTTTTGSNTAQRTISFVVSDGDGGASATLTKTVNVS
jgi:hypothetical protein